MAISSGNPTKYPNIAAWMAVFIADDQRACNVTGGVQGLNRTPEEVWVDEPEMKVSEDWLAAHPDAISTGSIDDSMPSVVYSTLNSIMQTLWDEVDDGGIPDDPTSAAALAAQAASRPKD